MAARKLVWLLLASTGITNVLAVTCPGFPGYCSESFPGQTCVVVCSRGRNNVPLCQEDGTWTDIPRCVEHEPGLELQVPGICPGIAGYCSEGFKDRRCRFACPVGPHIDSVCTQDGTWRPYPTCQGDLRELQDGCNPCPGPNGRQRNRTAEAIASAAAYSGDRVARPTFAGNQIFGRLPQQRKQPSPLLQIPTFAPRRKPLAGVAPSFGSGFFIGRDGMLRSGQTATPRFDSSMLHPRLQDILKTGLSRLPVSVGGGQPVTPPAAERRNQQLQPRRLSPAPAPANRAPVPQQPAPANRAPVPQQPVRHEEEAVPVTLFQEDKQNLPAAVGPDGGFFGPFQVFDPNRGSAKAATFGLPSFPAIPSEGDAFARRPSPPLPPSPAQRGRANEFGPFQVVPLK